MTLRKLNNDLKRIWYYLILLVILYFIIVSVNFGYDKNGMKTTLIVYFMGADKINSMLFQWLLIQTAITLYCIYIIKTELETVFIYTILKIKKVKDYFYCLTLRILLYIIIYYSIIFTVTLTLLYVSKSYLNSTDSYSRFMNMKPDVNVFILFGNSILSSCVFVSIVCILGIFFKDISKSYLVAIICQLLFVFILKYNKLIFRFIPLTQGIFALYDQEKYTYQFAFIYQIIILAVAIKMLELFFKKNIELFI